MGLDQYLERKVYVGNKYKKQADMVRVIVPKNQSKDVFSPIKGKLCNKKLQYLVYQEGYWRKANQIHNWFVENVQDGDDDCKEHYVDIEQLGQLLETVNKVLDASKLVPGKIENGYSFDDKGNKVPNLAEGKIIEDPTVAKELLPSSEGFFFGGTEYDEYYYQDLLDTKEILEPIVNDKDNTDDFYYSSSW